MPRIRLPSGISRGGSGGINEVRPCFLCLVLRSGGVLREAEGHVAVQ